MFKLTALRPNGDKHTSWYKTYTALEAGVKSLESQGCIHIIMVRESV